MESTNETELPLIIIGTLRTLDRDIQRYSVAVEKQLGIKATDLWFMQVLQKESGLSVTEVADRLSILQASASNILLRLTRKKYVTKNPSSEDKRAIHLTLTEAGREVVELSEKEMLCPLRRAMSFWSATELERLNSDLQRLVIQARELSRESEG